MPIRSAFPALWLLTCLPLAAGGFDLGLQRTFDRGAGLALVPNVDYLNTTTTSTMAGPASTVTLDGTQNILSASLDVNWFFRGDTDRGFFLIGGAGVAAGFLSVHGQATDGASGTARARDTVFYPEVGAGFLFNGRVGVEALYKDFRFKQVNLGIDGGTVAWSANGVLLVALVIRL